MVGVAGKSKGCNTCRKRKIACDQQRPVCTQCTRSKRICAGYTKDRVFVLVEPNSKRTHTYVRPDCQSAQSFSSSPAHSRDSLDLSVPPRITAILENQEPFGSLNETSAAYKIIKSRIEHHNMIQAFLSKCFSGTWTSRTARSWLPLLEELPTKANNDTLELSSIALATSVIGRDLQDSYMIESSLSFYTQGLRQLRKALRHPVLMGKDSTLAACMALNLYETIECPSKGSSGYFSHCHGLLAMIQARGVEKHASGAGHRLFLGIRVPGILYVLNHQSSTILSNPAWMEGPWTESPKSYLDRVTDCLVAAPGILARVPLLRSLREDQQGELIHQLVSECWEIDEELQKIDLEIQDSAPYPLYMTVPSRINPLSAQSDSTTMFPVAFSFLDSTIASTMTLMWATRTLLWSGLCSLYRQYEMLRENYYSFPMEDQMSTREFTGFIMQKLPALEHRADFISMARNVCQSIEYFLQDEMGLIGALSVTPAIGLVIDAFQNFPNYNSEIQWLRACLGLIRQKGIRVLDFSQLENE